MNPYLRDKLLQKLETMADERGYQLLDYAEFLESKYAERQPATAAAGNPLSRFADAVEEKLRAGTRERDYDRRDDEPDEQGGGSAQRRGGSGQVGRVGSDERDLARGRRRSRGRCIAGSPELDRRHDCCDWWHHAGRRDVAAGRWGAADERAEHRSDHPEVGSDA